MKLSNDQKKFLKFIPVYAVGYTVLSPLLRWLFSKSIQWQDFLNAAIVAVCVSVVVGLLFVVGSHIPKKND